MQIHQGNTAIRETIYGLTRIADECERRVAEKPDPELERIGRDHREAATRLAGALQAKLAAKAAVKLADMELEKAYASGQAMRRRGKAWLFATYFGSNSELAAFGVKHPRIAKKHLLAGVAGIENPAAASAPRPTAERRATPRRSGPAPGDASNDPTLD